MLYGIRKQNWQILNIGIWTTNIPDLSNLLILKGRYIEAAILKNVFNEIQKRFVRKTAEKIIGRACSNSTIARGVDMPQQIDHPENL